MGMFMNAAGTDFHSSLTLRYALPFLGRRYLQRMRHAPLPVQDCLRSAGHDPLAKGVRIRTAFFDDHIRAVLCGGSKVRQFVTLASGVDCRCLRLECLQQPGMRRQCREILGKPKSLLAFALSLAVLAVHGRSSMRKPARLVAASVALLLAAASGTRGMRKVSSE